MKAREYALNILDRVVNHHAYASLLMRRPPCALSTADQALASEIIYGTLRNMRFLAYQWLDLVHHVDAQTRVLLCMSVYQMQYMDRLPDCLLYTSDAADEL